jgi:DNA invertase Pin-like site-specific DNA recombinase
MVSVDTLVAVSSGLRLVAYIRVSTDAQAEEGYGLDAQREAVTRWAKGHGHRVVLVCTDEGVSGTLDALDREGLTCAIEAIESGEAGALVLARLDRLARRLHVQEAVLAQVWQRGGRVFTVDAGEVLPDDPDDPMRTAMRQMMGVFAELDRSMIAKRLRDGRRAKAAQGGYVAGSPSYGWRAEGGELVEDGTEKVHILSMERLRMEGASYREIVAWLEANGVMTKRGARWTPSAVQRVLDPDARERARLQTQRARART